MLTNRLSDSLNKHIYSFLVESNVDLMKSGLDSIWTSYTDCSTLSIMRRINKNSKRIIQGWQDSFQTFLKPHLESDPDFKKFYIKIRNRNFIEIN